MENVILHGTSISASIRMEGSLVLTIHMYELRETVFAGRDPGLIPCLRSTFVVIDLLVCTEKRKPSMNSACCLKGMELASCGTKYKLSIAGAVFS